MPVPLDEDPIHQVPPTMKDLVAIDHPVRDRCIIAAPSLDGAHQHATMAP